MKEKDTKITVKQEERKQSVQDVKDPGPAVQDGGQNDLAGGNGVIEDSGEKFKDAVQKTTQPQVSTLNSSQVIKSDPLKKEGLAIQLKSWVVPIASLLVMVLIAVLVFIPSGTEALDSLDEIRTTNQQIERNNQKIEALNSINLSQVNSLLQTADRVIKNSLEVAELAGDVEAIARDNNLTTQNVQFSSTSGVTTDIPGFVDVISGPFSYIGEFRDITNFLADLRTKSPTVLAIRSVAVNNESKSGDVGTDEEPLWSIDIVIDGFIAPKIETVSISDTVVTTVDEDLMEEIEQRIEYDDYIEN